ncbi:MAG: hypothetical protein R2716_13325 [Microthrixaceae bacterium]
MLASVDPGTEVACTVEAAGAGVAVPPEEPDAFCEALGELLSDAGELERMWPPRAQLRDEVSLTGGRRGVLREAFGELVQDRRAPR